MVLSVLTPQVMSTDLTTPDTLGLNPIVWTTVTGAGMKFTCTGKEMLLIRRADAGEAVVTLWSAACDEGHTTEHDVVFHLNYNATEPFMMYGPVSKGHFAQTWDATADQVKITMSGTLTLTQIAVIQFV